jgi:hypothetical protein
MKYWRIEKEETVTHVAHVIAPTREEAIKIAEDKIKKEGFERFNSWFTRPWGEEISKEEYEEAVEDEGSLN